MGDAHVSRIPGPFCCDDDTIRKQLEPAGRECALTVSRARCVHDPCPLAMFSVRLADLVGAHADASEVGAPVQDVVRLSAKHDASLPRWLQVLYQIHNGQDEGAAHIEPIGCLPEDAISFFPGLFGPDPTFPAHVGAHRTARRPTHVLLDRSGSQRRSTPALVITTRSLCNCLWLCRHASPGPRASTHRARERLPGGTIGGGGLR